jgi:hypothetical protein
MEIQGETNRANTRYGRRQIERWQELVNTPASFCRTLTFSGARTTRSAMKNGQVEKMQSETSMQSFPVSECCDSKSHRSITRPNSSS